MSGDYWQGRREFGEFHDDTLRVHPGPLLEHCPTHGDYRPASLIDAVCPACEVEHLNAVDRERIAARFLT